MTKHRTLTLLLALICLASCARISPRAITLTSTVDLAIKRLQTQTQSLIDAVAAQQVASLDDAWSSIYANADTAFRESNSMPPDAALLPENYATIAAIAAEVHDEIRTRIESVQLQLIADAKWNTDLVLSINAVVRNHLLSIASLTQSQQHTADLIESITESPIRSHWQELVSIFIPTASPTEISQ